MCFNYKTEENTKLSNFLKYHVFKGIWGSGGLDPCILNPRFRWRHLTYGCTHLRNRLTICPFIGSRVQGGQQRPYLDALDQSSWDLKLKSYVGTTNNSEIKEAATSLKQKNRLNISYNTKHSVQNTLLIKKMECCIL